MLQGHVVGTKSCNAYTEGLTLRGNVAETKCCNVHTEGTCSRDM